MGSTPTANHVQILQMGLGAAIKRLISIEFQFRMGQSSANLLEERDLLITAMDHLNIEIGFDCDNDGVPDNIEIFKAAAGTSCCRLMSTSSRREIPPDPAVVKVPRVSSSRKKVPLDPPPILVTEPVKEVPPVSQEPTKPTAPPKVKKKGLLGGLFGGRED